jgi:hypothetical protein
MYKYQVSRVRALRDSKTTYRYPVPLQNLTSRERIAYLLLPQFVPVYVRV